MSYNWLPLMDPDDPFSVASDKILASLKDDKKLSELMKPLVKWISKTDRLMQMRFADPDEVAALKVVILFMRLREHLLHDDEMIARAIDEAVYRTEFDGRKDNYDLPTNGYSRTLEG